MWIVSGLLADGSAAPERKATASLVQSRIPRGSSYGGSSKLEQEMRNLFAEYRRPPDSAAHIWDKLSETRPDLRDLDSVVADLMATRKLHCAWYSSHAGQEKELEDRMGSHSHDTRPTYMDCAELIARR